MASSEQNRISDENNILTNEISLKLESYGEKNPLKSACFENISSTKNNLEVRNKFMEDGFDHDKMDSSLRCGTDVSETVIKEEHPHGIKAQTSRTDGVLIGHAEVVIKEEKIDTEENIEEEGYEHNIKGAEVLIKEECKEIEIEYDGRTAAELAGENINTHTQNYETKYFYPKEENENHFYNVSNLQQNASVSDSNFFMREFDLERTEDDSLIKDKRKYVKTKGKKTYSCALCGKGFTFLINLRRHEKLHNGQKPYSCSVCGKEFAVKFNLLEHEKVHSDERSYSCQLCDRKFKMQAALARHKKNHSGEKPHGCAECGKKFVHKSDLTTHSKIHSGKKDFGCNKCSMAFSRKSHLERHERTHEGNKLYNCELCSKGYTEKDSLKKHMKSHSDVKPFVCGVCGANFSDKYSLTRHFLVHTGEKSHACSVCSKTFTRKTHLDRHFKNIHCQPQSQSCEYCGKIFVKKKFLIKHLLLHKESVKGSDNK